MEIFTNSFKCANCGKDVSTSHNYIKIVFIKKDKEGKHKFFFCSTSCMEQWLISHTSADEPVEAYSLEKDIEKENIGPKKEEIIKKKEKTIEEEIKLENYDINNNSDNKKYNIKYNNVQEEKEKGKDLITKKLEIVDGKEHQYVEYQEVKQRFKYHPRPKTFFEKFKDKLKITKQMLDYED